MRPSQSTVVRPYVSFTSWLVGHDDHEVRRDAVRARRAVRLPVREVRRLHEHRLADLRHVERDRVDVLVDVRDLASARSASPSCAASCLMSMCFHDFGPDATHTLSSCAAFMNHGAAAHSHGGQFQFLVRYVLLSRRGAHVARAVDVGGRAAPVRRDRLVARPGAGILVGRRVLDGGSFVARRGARATVG